MPEVQDIKKEKKRRAIIRASLRVFARKGYETSALDEVAREANLAKGTLDHVPTDIVETLAPALAEHRDRIANDPRIVAYTTR